MHPVGPIAVMDSGIGGLPYLDASRRLLPNLPFVYLADREGFPYGTKSREKVEAIVLDRVRRLVAGWNPRAIVIACNTASQAALGAVRAANPDIPVIGTVPAIKPAAEHTRSGTIGVLATERTVRDPYLDDLVAAFASGKRVSRRGAQDLVEFVEHRFATSTAAERREAVLPHVRFLLEAGADQIVLACTHFLHVADDIAACARDLAGGGGGFPVTVIDSREGVARRLLQVLTDEGGLVDPPSDRLGEAGGASTAWSWLVLSGPEPYEDSYREFARRYGLEGPVALGPDDSGPQASGQQASGPKARDQAVP